MNKINQSDIFNIDIDTIDKISLFEIYAEDEASRKHPVFYLLSTEEYLTLGSLAFFIILQLCPV